MGSARTERLALVISAATIGVLIGSFVLVARFSVPGQYLVESVVFVMFVVSFAGVGYLLSSRRPGNPIGWVFAAMGFALTLAIFTGNYGQYGLLVEPGALPGASLAAWVGNWIWLIVLGPIGYVLLLFPDGRPPSLRWRPTGWLLTAGLLGWFLSQGFSPGPLSNAGYPHLENPFGLPVLEDFSAVLGAASAALIVLGALLSAASVVVRFRASVGDERRQMKWLVYAGLITIAIVCIELPLEAVLGDDHPATRVFQLGMFTAVDLIPVAIGVAILRYRLYDIDLLINRTLVYGSLSVLLGLVYLGGVVIVGTALRTLTAREDELAVAASTLVIAAMFGPARRRVQSFIDRRFYRSRYDAARTLETFTGRLRDEVDLEALRTDLLGVVRDTLRPSHASVWLRR